ncbi:hypothetical protein PsorP6_004384 [Peronosclerospora sorghi]|uniref:Uncharacterized protein n=1 Tax=Peronosclerospora sorghi TaxID=230839 RepID=A0ACC0VJH7_9STRA|nr:hypothetical protein PsorP6_004384 [Peronosclerospora sorghi]
MGPRRRDLQCWKERLRWKPAQRRAAAEQVQPDMIGRRRQERSVSGAKQVQKLIEKRSAVFVAC